MNNAFDVPRAKAEMDRDASAENLKALREAAGLSLHDIFSKTRVSIANLTALENGDFKNLPPPIYTRNFISKYVEAVGIDGKPLRERYEKYIATISEPSEVTEIKKPWPGNNLKYWFLFGSLALVVAVGVIVVALFLYHTDKPAPPATPAVGAALPNAAADKSALEKTPSVEPSPSTEAIPPGTEQKTTNPSGEQAKTEAVPATGKTPSSTPVENAKNGYHLSIKALETTWIKIVADKTNISEVLLKPGETIERTASDNFRLDIGNAGGVDVTFQRKSLGRLGKSGEVVILNLPPAAVNQNVN